MISSSSNSLNPKYTVSNMCTTTASQSRASIEQLELAWKIERIRFPNLILLHPWYLFEKGSCFDIIILEFRKNQIGKEIFLIALLFDLAYFHQLLNAINIVKWGSHCEFKRKKQFWKNYHLLPDVVRVIFGDYVLLDLIKVV